MNDEYWINYADIISWGKAHIMAQLLSRHYDDDTVLGHSITSSLKSLQVSRYPICVGCTYNAVVDSNDKLLYYNNYKTAKTSRERGCLDISLYSVEKKNLTWKVCVSWLYLVYLLQLEMTQVTPVGWGQMLSHNYLHYSIT
jgi:hypothetical protein